MARTYGSKGGWLDQYRIFHREPITLTGPASIVPENVVQFLSPHAVQEIANLPGANRHAQSRARGCWDANEKDGYKAYHAIANAYEAWEKGRRTVMSDIDFNTWVIHKENPKKVSRIPRKAPNVKNPVVHFDASVARAKTAKDFMKVLGAEQDLRRPGSTKRWTTGYVARVKQKWDEMQARKTQNPRSAIGGGAPRGIWGRAVDALVAFKKAGNAWVAAGRPRPGGLYTDFVTAEREYNAARDEADKWDWNDEQAAEWGRVNRAFDPLLPGQVGYKANPKRKKPSARSKLYARAAELHQQGMSMGDNATGRALVQQANRLWTQGHLVNPATVFGWSSPRPNIDGSIPKPWRVAHADVLKVMLTRAGYPESAVYTEYLSKPDHEAIWVGVRDNRDVKGHSAALEKIATLLRSWKIGKVVRMRSGGRLSGLELVDRLKKRKTVRVKKPRSRA